MKPTVVDLFSGCGGFGLGAELAGFHCKVAVDIDPDLQSAYRLNFPATQTVTSDIRKMNEQSWRFLIGEEQIDGVIGGPPCQGFSRIGKNDKADPRRELIHHFFKAVNTIKPKFFIMENVEGLIDPGNINGLFDAISIVDKRYSVLNPLIVNASDYGAPTSRRRVIVVGYDHRFISPLSIEFLTENSVVRTTVSQAISDLPKPVPYVKGDKEFGWAKYPRRKTLHPYAQKMRTQPPKGIGSQYGRDMLDENLISGLFETLHSEDVKSRFLTTRQGAVEPISRYPKLDPRGLCPTLRAGTGKDRGNFQAARPIHPTEPRVITVREAARLQGFPDWFLFHPAKWHSFRMIGNSVSPLLAEHLMKRMISKITQKESAKKKIG